MEPQRITKTTQGDIQRAAPLFAKPVLSSRAPVHPFLQLQRTLGNQALGRFIQAKLKINQPGDVYEQEADRVADEVMRMPEPTSHDISSHSSPAIQRKCAACASGGGTCPQCVEEEKIMQRKPLTAQITPLIQRQATEEPEEEIQAKGISSTEGNTKVLMTKSFNIKPSTEISSLESDISHVENNGQHLPDNTRRFMENRFGIDFSGVRIHTDERSNNLAASLGARAFTIGEDIFFHKSEYQPENSCGRKLIAHELAHTIQQTGSAGRNIASGKKALPTPAHKTSKTGGHPSVQTFSIPKQIQRARFTVGSVTINVDFSGLHSIADADLVSAVESRFITFTGAADASAIHVQLTGLTVSQQRWVLYALDLLQDNTQSPLHDRLNRTIAVQRLVSHAPAAAHTFGSALGLPEEEALRVSGWFEVALAAHLGAPTAADITSIGEILNPPPAGGVGAALDVADFHARMEPAVRHLINQIDPAHWPATGTRTLSTLQTIGDELMTEARDFFSPYAHTSRTTVFGLNPPFHISANIFSVLTLTPNTALRKGYLRNRATIVGRNASVSPLFSDTNIFRDVNFDGTRPADRAEFELLVTNLEKDATVAAAVDRLIQHTGRQTGTGASTQIGLSTEFNADKSTECEARWEAINTLCHEIMHALAHPDFEAQTSNVSFGQVLLEGFPEVLGVQMFNHRVKPKAASEAAFKGRMETGLASAPCPAPPDATIGYGAAGSGAESIRTKASVGDNKFRSAFFLGQIHLIGL